MDTIMCPTGFARVASLLAMAVAEQCQSISDAVCPQASALAIKTCRYSATCLNHRLASRGSAFYMRQKSAHFSKAGVYWLKVEPLQ